MKSISHSTSARVLAGLPFFLVSIFFIGLTASDLSAKARARRTSTNLNSNSTSIAVPATPVPANFSGTYDPNTFPCATPRHHFVVPVGQARIVVQVSATIPTNDLTMTLLFGPDPSPLPLHTEDTATSSEAYLYQPAGGVPPGEYQVQICQTPSTNGVPQMAPFTYNGTFAYDDTAGGGSPPFFGQLPAAPQDNGPKIGYENFEPPGILTPVKVTSSGGLTVEYLGRNAIEPSIGANWSSGIINYKCDLEMLFIDFANSCSASGSNASWVNRASPTSVFVDSDPIGFTDRETNRVFCSELTLLGVNTVKNAHTDNDGLTWSVDQTGGIGSAVDHQTIGGGRFHTPIPSPLPTSYQNAVYYCSQNLGADAQCATSLDGGQTYGPSIAIYNEATCGGLHGHLKVSPVDGTVLVPNKGCGGIQSVVVSEDNGVTWSIRPVKTDTQAAAPPTVGTGDDPAVAIDAGGRAYFVFSNFGGGPGAGAGVAISDDNGATWKNMFDVGAIYGVKNICFPTATAGDAGRAAVSFYGSTTPQGAATGDSNDGSFTGVWHMYVAHTFDGGKTWTTTDVTPTMPMQRSGLLRGGGADAWRNLADFYDMTTDRDGRVLVGYGNGCASGDCALAPLNPDGTSAVKGNAYTATTSIARQSSGRRMLVAKDPASSTSVPGMPFVRQRRVGNTVRLIWNESDSGNSMINNYQIFRGTASGAESATPIATVAGTQTGGTYTDNTATDITKTYYYKVVANNSIGSSCPNNEIAAPYIGDTCSGLILHRNDPTHPESTGAGSAGQPPIPQLLIDYVAVGEPPDSPGNLMFKMKVVDLSSVPPNSRWRIAWDWYHPTADPSKPDQLYYVGMTSDAQSNVTFEYGTLADAGVPAVLVLGETTIATLAQSPTGTHYDPDGTITMFVPKAGAGNPQVGDLLGAIGGKTITGDAPGTPEAKLERSTAFVDHTFVKGNTDNVFPAVTYTLSGNNNCSTGQIVPVGAVSRKTHGSAGTFDVDLPLVGAPGIECRTGGANGDHKVVITFAVPVNVSSASVTPGQGASGSVSSYSVNNTQVTVNLTGVTNAQTVQVNLIGTAAGNPQTFNVSIPMGVLAGDTTANRAVNSSDIAQTQSQSGQTVTNANFREDVTVNGAINSSDIAFVQSKSGTALP